MYLRYFGFQDHPFSITPDPAFLYLSAYHREALGHLLYGTGEHGGFVQLTGEVGTGKTTLIRALLEQEQPELDIALCLNPHLTVTEFIASICDDLGVKYPRNRSLTHKELVDRLNAHLLEAHAAGRRTVLIIDEAQNLSREVLEQVRLLTNLETRKHKLLRIILVGQPELEAVLRRTDLRQIAQRITARYHLQSLSRAETGHYIRHRLELVGGAPHLFSNAACWAVHWYARGTPRLINTICERALMGAYSRGNKRIGVAMVRQAARETLPRRPRSEPGLLRYQLIPVAVLVIAALLAFGLHYSLIAPSDAAAGGKKAQPAAAEVAAPPTDDESKAEPQPPAPESDADKPQTASAQNETAQTETARPAPQKSAADYSLPAGNAGMSQLLRMWGVFGAEVDARCDDLSIGDLRCLAERGSFDDLERFDRPALLVLQQGKRRRRVLLSGLTETTATLVFADGTREWPRAALANLWTGEFQIVWRLQTATRSIGQGSVGDAVVWLRRRLGRAEGIDLDTHAGRPSPVFDEQLQAKLRRFQITHGLKPDGLVGSRTMILLNNLAPAPATPLLHPREAA